MAIYHNSKNVKQIFGPRKINKVYSNNDLFFPVSYLRERLYWN